MADEIEFGFDLPDLPVPPDVRINPEDILVPQSELSANNELLIAAIEKQFSFFYDFPEGESDDTLQPIEALHAAELRLENTDLGLANVVLVAPEYMASEPQAYYTSRIATIKGFEPQALIVTPHTDPRFSGRLMTIVDGMLVGTQDVFNLDGYSGCGGHKTNILRLDSPPGYQKPPAALDHSMETELVVICYGCVAVPNKHPSSKYGSMNVETV
jgi:hypothetical protein